MIRSRSCHIRQITFRSRVLNSTTPTVAIALTVGFCAGGASTITATKEGRVWSGGIPYYLPRPYLVVMKNIVPAAPKTKTEKKTEKKGDKETTTTTETNEVVYPPIDPNDTYTAQIVYLPDLHERYKLNIVARSGTFDFDLDLKDGWQLTHVSLESDSILLSFE